MPLWRGPLLFQVHVQLRAQALAVPSSISRLLTDFIQEPVAGRDAVGRLELGKLSL